MQFPPSGWQLYANLLEQFQDMMQLNSKNENLHITCTATVILI